MFQTKSEQITCEIKQIVVTFIWKFSQLESIPITEEERSEETSYNKLNITTYYKTI